MDIEVEGRSILGFHYLISYRMPYASELPCELKLLILDELLLIDPSGQSLRDMCLVWRDTIPVIRRHIFQAINTSNFSEWPAEQWIPHLLTAPTYVSSVVQRLAIHSLEPACVVHIHLVDVALHFVNVQDLALHMIAFGTVPDLSALCGALSRLPVHDLLL